MNQAQQILPADRRRVITTMETIKSVWKDAEQLLRITTPTADNFPVVPQIVRVEVPVPVEPAKVLAETSTAMLVAQLAERLFQFSDRVLRTWATSSGRTVAPLEARRVVTYPEPQAVTLHRKPRVAIVGLLKDQFLRIQTKVQDRLDLVYIDKEWSKTDIPASCDFVVVTRHVDHRWTDSARRKLPAERVFWADGAGDSSVLNRLYEVLNQQTAVFKT